MAGKYQDYVNLNKNYFTPTLPTKNINNKINDEIQNWHFNDEIF